MRTVAESLGLALMILAGSASYGMAQVASPPLAGSSGAAAPMALTTPSASPQEKQVQGPVKKVDPIAKTVQVGWLFGLFRTTLAVTDDTQIAVGGTKASLQDIRGGEVVKASYEYRDGQNVAKSIEVTSPGPNEEAPAQNAAPSAMPSTGGSSPSPGRTTTP